MLARAGAGAGRACGCGAGGDANAIRAHTLGSIVRAVRCAFTRGCARDAEAASCESAKLKAVTAKSDAATSAAM